MTEQIYSGTVPLHYKRYGEEHENHRDPVWSFGSLDN